MANWHLGRAGVGHAHPGCFNQQRSGFAFKPLSEAKTLVIPHQGFSFSGAHRARRETKSVLADERWLNQYIVNTLVEKVTNYLPAASGQTVSYFLGVSYCLLLVSSMDSVQQLSCTAQQLHGTLQHYKRPSDVTRSTIMPCEPCSCSSPAW